ncbi:MAG: arylesterase [Rhodobacteraceae bacterium]|nr:arylesterase [Paracoccaceae bacterium]
MFALIAPACAAAPVQLLAFGDSLTAGYGLAPDEGFVPQLQAWLADRGRDVAVVNGGVSGDTTAGGKARIGWALSDQVDAMILTLGGNDLLRGIAPEDARANLDAIIQTALARNIPVLLVPMSAPGNFGPDYKAAFDAIYPDLAAKYGLHLAQPFLQPILDLPDRKAAFAEYVQRDGLHPNSKGVALVVAALGPEVLGLIDGLKAR